MTLPPSATLPPPVSPVPGVTVNAEFASLALVMEPFAMTPVTPVRPEPSPLKVPVVVPPRVRSEPREIVVVPPSATLPPPLSPPPTVMLIAALTSLALVIAASASCAAVMLPSAGAMSRWISMSSSHG